MDNKQNRLHTLTPRVLAENLERFTREVKESLDSSWNKINISRSLHGLQKLQSTQAVQGLVAALTTKIGHSNATLDAQAIGNALYGLQKMDATSLAVQGLVEALKSKIVDSGAILNVQAIGNALYGLQKMDATSLAAQGLVAALKTKILDSGAILNAQAIGNALYGLQKMDATSLAVQDLVAALKTKIECSNAILNAQHIGMALYGLQKMDATSPAVQDLVTALKTKILDSGAILNAQAIGNALYGLQNMDATSLAVQDLVAALKTKIVDSDAVLNAQEIGNALYGLQKMDATSPAVQDLVAALKTKIGRSNAMLDAQAIGNALYGLQNMDATSLAVQDLVAALKTKIECSNAILNAQHIGMALYGLRKMKIDINVDVDSKVSYLLYALHDKIITSLPEFDADAFIITIHGIKILNNQDEKKESIFDEAFNLTILSDIKAQRFSKKQSVQILQDVTIFYEKSQNKQAYAMIVSELFSQFMPEKLFSFEMAQVIHYFTMFQEVLDEKCHILLKKILSNLYPLSFFSEKTRTQLLEDFKILKDCRDGLLYASIESIENVWKQSSKNHKSNEPDFDDGISDDNYGPDFDDGRNDKYDESQATSHKPDDVPRAEVTSHYIQQMPTSLDESAAPAEGRLDSSGKPTSHKRRYSEFSSVCSDEAPEFLEAKTNSPIFEAIADKDLDKLYRLLGISQRTKKTSSSYSSSFFKTKTDSNRIVSPTSNQQSALNSPTSYKSKNFADKIMREFLEKTHPEALKILIERSTAECFSVLLESCSFHERYQLAIDGLLRPLFLFFSDECLEEIVVDCIGSKKHTLGLYRDHEALLSLIDMLTLRGLRNPTKQNAVKALQQQLFECCISYHRRKGHVHVVPRLENEQKRLNTEFSLQDDDYNDVDKWSIWGVEYDPNNFDKQSIPTEALASSIVSSSSNGSLSSGFSGTFFSSNHVPKRFTGTIDAQEHFFNLESVAGDGNCGFNALNITRDQLADLLQNQLENLAVRNRFLVPMRENLKILRHPLFCGVEASEEALLVSNNDAGKNIQDFPEFLELDGLKNRSNRRVQWLRKNGHNETAQTIEQKLSEFLTAERFFEEHLQSPFAFESYITELRNDLWIDTESIRFYAEQNRWTVRIWMQEQGTLCLNLHAGHEDANAVQTHDILFNGTHYDRLVLQQTAENRAWFKSS